MPERFHLYIVYAMRDFIAASRRPMADRKGLIYDLLWSYRPSDIDNHFDAAWDLAKARRAA